MSKTKIIIPHEGVNEIPKGYKPLMTSEGKLVAIVPEGMTKNDVYWIKTERIIPVIDWEQRRYELAKAAMQGYCANSLEYVVSSANHENIAEWSVSTADAMIKLLKEMMESVSQLIESVKSGGRPPFIGVLLSESQIEELRPYVDDEYYNNVLKSRLKKTN